MGVFYYTKLAGLSWSATDAQAGYPASNAGLESIARDWRAVDAGTKDWVVNFAAATTVQALLLEDVNFASAAVLKSPDGSSFSSVGTLTTYADKLTGRRRGLIVVNDANVKALKVTITSGSTMDGLTYWRVGASYPFAAVSTLARMADYGMRVRAIFPKVSVELPNKQIAQAVTGADILAVSMSFNRQFDEDVLELQRRARVATVGLSLGLSDYPELVFPARYIDEGVEDALNFYRRSQTSMELREVT